jgi:hypothetical protein
MPRTPALAGGRVPQLERLKVVACRTTCLVKHQKLRKKIKNLDKTTYGKSNHSHLPRAAGGTFLPAEDPPDLWGPSPTFEPPGGGVGDGGLVSDGGRYCGGGGAAPLCFSTPVVFWRLGAGSPTKEPSPRWSLRDLLPSAWLRRSGAAP